MLIPLIVPDVATRNDKRTYRASTPNIDKLKSRFCANEIVPSTAVHAGLSAGRREFETAIVNSPDAAAFSLMN